MKRTSIIKVHIVATVVAMITIFSFFTASLYAELVNDEALIVATKTVIFYCLPLMIFAMPTLAFTGNLLAGSSRSALIKTKRRRMKIIAINGLMLVTLAVFLFIRARSGQLDSLFLSAQCLELLLGVVNFVLLSLNARVGWVLSGRIKKVVSL